MVVCRFYVNNPVIDWDVQTTISLIQLLWQELQVLSLFFCFVLSSIFGNQELPFRDLFSFVSWYASVDNEKHSHDVRW